MASISASVPTFSPSLSQLQKPMITTRGSPVLRLPSMTKMGRLRCSVEGKPAVTTDEGAQSGNATEKSAWPELIGEKGEVAAAIIKKENPLLDPIVTSETLVTNDFVFNRVRVKVDSEGVVTQTPVIG